ncbi:MAG: lysophospholipid acyltransferase family protein [Bacteroidales bacterium]|nr:lysophospholipid acyltransferase family protein [Bacteroidales bacterium]
MIIKAKHHFIIDPFFQSYAQYIVKRHFEKVQIYSHVDVEDYPVLLIANHISWWDGFWLMLLNLKVLHKKFHFMMLKEQLRKHWYFNYAGGFSVSKNSRSILESLDYAAALLKSKDNMVIVFPQGKINSMHNQHFTFEKGMERIVAENHGKLKVIMVANMVDYFSNAKPSLSIYAKEMENFSMGIETMQKMYQNFYNGCIQRQKSKVE